jgi:hypothetical protein
MNASDLLFSIVPTLGGFTAVVTSSRVGNKRVAGALAALADRLGGEFTDGYGIVFETAFKSRNEAAREIARVKSVVGA